MSTSWSMLSKSKFSLIFTFVILFTCCKQPSESSDDVIDDDSTEESATMTLSDEFLQFYEAFHLDEKYQLDHIVFPLATNSYSETGEVEKKVWTPDNWVMHKPFNVMDETFTRTYTEFGGIITEVISDNQGLLSIERRFSKIQEEWHLIFYDPMHLVKN